MQPPNGPSRASIHIDDPKVMRALAHPARLAIMARLSEVGPGTATECAEVTGLSPSATSYHLRALADAELIEEAEHTDGRKHLWRARASRMVVGASEDDGGVASRHLLRELLNRSDRQLEQWLDVEESQPQEWREALSIVNARVEVHPAELAQLIGDINALFEAYTGKAREGAESGRRPVTISLRAVPEAKTSK
ncbi:ArsR/SmtB family transcription factor [Kitasatospora sp. NPDC051853]|uniref:ArsR/SmtB family transcription factor n=1 Tax=Kitasatospora sp. NPDC051853 TaxID=3364058 RepID=UPI0037BC0ED3